MRAATLLFIAPAAFAVEKRAHTLATCSKRLVCPDKDCWLTVGCSTGKGPNAAYRAAFCDEYTGEYKCNCPSRFTPKEQELYQWHQKAVRPICPPGAIVPDKPVEAVKPTVSGDPFTTDKSGNRVQFYLPLHQDTSLLACGDFALHGSSMGSGIAGDHQQWFEQFRVLIAGKEKLRVSANRTDASSNLTTIAVTIEGTAIKQPVEVAYDGFDIDVHQDKDIPIGRGFSETVHFSAGSTMLSIMSAGVMKEDSKEVRRVHLDLGFTSLESSTCTSGVLAEIWGNIPMSNSTSAMLQPPAQ